jgi:hypothetical protein
LQPDCSPSPTGSQPPDHRWRWPRAKSHATRARRHLTNLDETRRHLASTAVRRCLEATTLAGRAYRPASKRRRRPRHNPPCPGRSRQQHVPSALWGLVSGSVPDDFKWRRCRRTRRASHRRSRTSAPTQSPTAQPPIRSPMRTPARVLPGSSREQDWPPEPLLPRGCLVSPREADWIPLDPCMSGFCRSGVGQLAVSATRHAADRRK